MLLISFTHSFSYSLVAAPSTEALLSGTSASEPAPEAATTSPNLSMSSTYPVSHWFSVNFPATLVFCAPGSPDSPSTPSLFPIASTMPFLSFRAFATLFLLRTCVSGPLLSSLFP